MKIASNEQKLARVLIAALAVMIVAGGIYFGLKKFWLKKADVGLTNSISNTAAVSYSVDGQAISNTSDPLRISKIGLLGLILSLQGRSAQDINGVSGTMTVIDPDADTTLGAVDFTTGADGSSQPDWSGISTITIPFKLYDLRVTVPGYLSKKVRDVNLGQTVDVETGALLAGDVDGNGVINWDDYDLWSKDYGQTKVSSTNSKDFNADGVINYLDFAIAYGSSNWMKTEASQ